MPGASGAIERLFEPGDHAARAWDEAEAVLAACGDLAGVMATVRDAESPVEARRALKRGFGLTGRQAALLLTMPVMSFTRSERDRLDGHRRACVEMIADVTGCLPAVRDEPSSADPSSVEPSSADVDWADDLDRVLDRLLSSMDDPWWADAPAEPKPRPSAETQTQPPTQTPPTRSARRSVDGHQDAAAVIDEQIGELCDAIAALVGAEPGPTWSAGDVLVDDPRHPGSPSGAVLDSCGVDDSTGLRTLLWHLRRTGLDAVEGLFPFAEPLSAGRAVDEQAARFEQAMAAGRLGVEPGGDAVWAGRLWPIGHRSGFGDAGSDREGPGVGSVWAYGGGEPLHRLWDSVIDLLAEIYQSLTTGSPCDAALATAARGRVVWTNLS